MRIKVITYGDLKKISCHVVELNFQDKLVYLSFVSRLNYK